jgi:hypothetical protein
VFGDGRRAARAANSNECVIPSRAAARDLARGGTRRSLACGSGRLRNARQRAVIERELADLQAAIDRLRLRQQQLEAESLRLQSELVQLQAQSR